ncbi:MAG TPA: hypothetical protein VFI70_05510 [Nitrososphaeraceae archaeon]|nr:hypothetical protein [Nitrososphaeraceae archaeon]
MIKQKSIIRIAMHPRDSHGALEEQKHMINRLKDIGYIASTYRELCTQIVLINEFQLCCSPFKDRHERSLGARI